MKMGKADLEKYTKRLRALQRVHVTVVGDVMLDEYVWGHATRISPEAPVPVVEVQSRTYHPGGAANTVANMLSIGARATLVGLVGRDPNGKLLKDILKERGMDTSGLIADAERPTTTKTRIVAQGQQVMRADHEDPSAASPGTTRKLLKAVERLMPRTNGIAVSDYNKGVVTADFMSGLIRMAREQKKIITADIKPGNAAYFKGVTLITPNRLEASQILGSRIRDDEDLKKGGAELRKMMGAEYVLITLGEDGMALFRNGKPMMKIPAVSTQVYDVTGAGDTVLSVAALSLAAGHAIEDAVHLANYAAGVVVRKRGTAAVTPEEIIKFLEGQMA